MKSLSSGQNRSPSNDDIVIKVRVRLGEEFNGCHSFACPTSNVYRTFIEPSSPLPLLESTKRVNLFWAPRREQCLIDLREARAPLKINRFRSHYTSWSRIISRGTPSFEHTSRVFLLPYLWCVWLCLRGRRPCPDFTSASRLHLVDIRSPGEKEDKNKAHWRVSAGTGTIGII